MRRARSRPAGREPLPGGENMKHDPLAMLQEEGVVDEVVGRLKSGKEADVWLVRHGGVLVAAKIYKQREFRSFKNDAGYKEGRTVRNSRTQRAMDKGSKFGRASAEEAWKSAEADALFTLHAAGVCVPKPVLFFEGVLLMELVLAEDGHPAPRLIDAEITAENAGPLYEFLRGEAVKMLMADLIHGDLSPYNVLIGPTGPVIIDFPQTIAAAKNSQSEQYFERDLENLRGFFGGFDPAVKARTGDTGEIWRAYVRRELTADFVPSGRPAPIAPPPRAPQAAPRASPGGGRPHPGGGRSQPAAEGRAPSGHRPHGGAGHRPGAGAAPAAPGARSHAGGPRSHEGDRRPQPGARPQGGAPVESRAARPQGGAPAGGRGARPPSAPPAERRGARPQGGGGQRPAGHGAGRQNGGGRPPREPRPSAPPPNASRAPTSRPAVEVRSVPRPASPPRPPGTPRPPHRGPRS